jgi:L-iditol 2-dehydrogenase
VPAERVHPLPERLSFLEGALCEPLACCVHGVMEQTGIRPGDVAVVAGVGAIGLLSLQVARACGAQVVVCGTDLDDERLLIARDLGAAQTVNVQRKDANSFAGALTGDEGADVFLECSGAPAAARMGLTLLRRGGRYCQIGLFGSPLDLDFELVAYKELAVSGAIGSRWTSWRTALRLLESGAVRVRPLIGDPLPLGDWQEGFRRFETKQGIKTLLRPD